MNKTLLKTAKILRITFGIAIIGAIALATYIYIHEELPKKKIIITVSYSPKEPCSKGFPMEVSIINNSSRTLKETEFNIEVKRKGYSKNISTYIFSHYNTDKIIEPKNTFRTCWTYPEIKKEHEGKYKKEDLIYKIGYTHFNFEN